jgi:DNA-binding response OmpR family regulator
MTRNTLIAVVDDENSICRALKRLLEASGFDVLTFPSGKEFVDALGTDQIDCAVLDLHMPGLSGLDLLKWLRSDGRQIPVIVVTGRDEHNTRALCLAAGACAYLPKPLDASQLLHAIADALAPRRAS